MDCPGLPTTGGIPWLFVVAASALILTGVMLLRRAGASRALAVVVLVGASALALSARPADAARDCPPATTRSAAIGATSTAVPVSPTTTTTTTTTVPGVTTTTAPAPSTTSTTSTTTTTVPIIATLAGTYTRQGSRYDPNDPSMGDPPGVYDTPPNPTPCTPADPPFPECWNPGLAAADNGPMAGVEVSLLDGAGNVIATTTTAADGSYSFGVTTPGDYSTTLSTLPPDRSGTWSWTYPNGGGGFTITPWTLTPSQHDVTVAAGDAIAGLDFIATNQSGGGGGNN